MIMARSKDNRETTAMYYCNAVVSFHPFGNPSQAPGLRNSELSLISSLEKRPGIVYKAPHSFI